MLAPPAPAPACKTGTPTLAPRFVISYSLYSLTERVTAGTSPGDRSGESNSIHAASSTP